jgi:ribonucleoside-diphosphate reductase alpha chain
MLAGVSSGIEPVYEFSFKRRWRGGEEIVYHPLFEEWKKQNPNGEKPGYFVSANDLTPSDHVKVQAIAQEYIDSSISKTVNAPNNHTVEDVKNLYMMAYDMGLKGITYMRDGSRQGVLERTDTDQKKQEEAPKVEVQKPEIQKPIVNIIPRPMIAHGTTYKMQTPVGVAYITINTDENDEPLEVFINGVGKAGSDLFAMAEGLGRMISLNLRVATYMSREQKIKKVIDELLNIGGASVMGFGKNQIRSLPDAVAKALSMKYKLNGFGEKSKTNGQSLNGHMTNGNGHTTEEMKKVLTDDNSGAMTAIAEGQIAIQAMPLDEMERPMTTHDICPECGDASMVYEEGCQKCYSCGASKC